MMFVNCHILKLTSWKKSVLLFSEAAWVRKSLSTLLMAQCWRHSKHSLGLLYVTDGTDHISALEYLNWCLVTSVFSDTCKNISINGHGDTIFFKKWPSTVPFLNEWCGNVSLWLAEWGTWILGSESHVLLHKRIVPFGHGNYTCFVVVSVICFIKDVI